MNPPLKAEAVIGANPDETLDSKGLKSRLHKIRSITETLCNPLETEDYGLQCRAETSPPKWHLAHTTWFFETFLLVPHHKNYRVFDNRFHDLFNSYYQSLGTPFARHHRGLLSRPTVREVYAYRAHVDRALEEFLSEPGAPENPRFREILEWGLQHEQQHQELLLMDIKANLAFNPLRPAYLPASSFPAAFPGAESATEAPTLGWVEFTGGNRNIGAAFYGNGHDFAFDNEGPRHILYLEPYALADRLVTCGEYLRFMEDGGYARPELWLSDGWEVMQKQGWLAPLYWEERDRHWFQYTLHGMRAVDPASPVCHVSFFEADAYARWAGKRLPTEAEWENAVSVGTDGMWRRSADHANFVEAGLLHPSPAQADGPAINGIRQAFGDVWEWTQSAYAPYPGFKPPPGALGEYNGKFMNNQRVLRGGSCVTPASHARPTYRNFFRPEDRWPFTGVRLCDESRI